MPNLYRKSEILIRQAVAGFSTDLSTQFCTGRIARPDPLERPIL
ncbi:hypothetical protein NJ7G_3275 [Natrinema sp. J7-2]|nr:hypothetical protein NJ7G_3275 [Natrinema sp. J7-2]